MSSPSVVNLIVKGPSNETPAMKNKIFGPFRFVKLRFPSIAEKPRFNESQNTQDFVLYSKVCVIAAFLV
jgi:hypothetical protein